MRKILFVFLSCLLCSIAKGQQCVVYAMIGKATVGTKKGARVLRLRETLQPSATITIPYNATLELFDQANRRKYVVRTPGTGTLQSFIDNQKTDRISLSDRIFNYMLRRITSTDETLIQSCSDPAAVTREELKDTTVYLTP